jgi:hypothetical protein
MRIDADVAVVHACGLLQATVDTGLLPAHSARAQIAAGLDRDWCGPWTRRLARHGQPALRKAGVEDRPGAVAGPSAVSTLPGRVTVPMRPCGPAVGALHGVQEDRCQPTRT